MAIAYEVRTALAKRMEAVWPLHPAITTDHWTSITNDSYASLTVHYIDAKWKLVSKSMGVTPFGRPHTAVRVADITKEILEGISMPPNWRPTITTDSAAVMRAAFEKELE